MDRRLLWSEHVPYARLASNDVLRALDAHDVELVVAVHPYQTEELPALLRAFEARSLPLRIWPLLEDHAGRWLSGWTSEAYAPHLRAVLAVVGESAVVREVIFDLEPPIARVKRTLQNFPSASWLFRSVDPKQTRERICALIEEVRRAGHGVSAVVPPFLLWDEGDFIGIETSLGTPVRGLDFDQVWVMAYTSLLEGYSRGILRRRDARWLLSNWSAAAVSRYGEKAGVALGVVGGGALGDERPYRDQSELRDDVAIAAQAGVAQVALFGLAGLLAREPMSQWLEALHQPEFAGPPPKATRRTRALTELGRSISRLR